jgi:hypothetical protein
MEKPVHIIHPDWDELNCVMNHEVLLATLACGTVVALDPTGIQFGWKETVAPWTSYQQHRISHLAERHTVGPMRPGAKFLMPTALQVPGMGGGGSAASGILMEAVVLNLLSQIKTKFGGVKSLLKLKGSKFSEAEAAVVAAAHGGLSLLAEEIKNSAVMFIANDIVAAAASGDKDYVEVDMVWCTEQERAIAARNPEKLVLTRWKWNARWTKVAAIRLPEDQRKAAFFEACLGGQELDLDAIMAGTFALSKGKK